MANLANLATLPRDDETRKSQRDKQRIFTLRPPGIERGPIMLIQEHRSSPTELMASTSIGVPQLFSSQPDCQRSKHRFHN
jgi:hypothetical protein